MLFAALSFAQNLQVSKSPGDPTTISWTFSTANEPQISGFQLQSASTAAGPWTGGATAAVSARSLTFPAPAAPTFYQVVSYKDTTGQPRAFSTPSNLVALQIVLPPPGLTALQ